MTPRLAPLSGAFLIAVAASLCHAGKAQAQPSLIGPWTAPMPPGVIQVFEFGPGQYFGNGTWHGPVTYTVSGCFVAAGTYELFMFTGVEGTLTIKDTPGGFGVVGNVNFASREFVYKNVVFRH